jgi:rod shape-determining protein MreB
MATSGSGRDLVLDLGTSTLRLARIVPGKYQGPAADGEDVIVLPAVTLVDPQRHSVVAVGAQAAAIARGTLPTGVELVPPWRDGLVAAFDPAVALVRAALHEALGGERALRRLARRPRALYTLPAPATDADRQITQDVLQYAGIGTALAVPATLAAAVGAELPIRGARPHAVCDIGAGRAEIAVLAGGRIQIAGSWPLGGDWFNRAVVRAVRRRGISITPAMAEEARREFGTLDQAAQVVEGTRVAVSAGGAFGEVPPNPHNRSGLPEFRTEDVSAGLNEATRVLVERLAWFWEDLDAPTREVVRRDGLTLTGGAAQVPGLAEALSRALDLPVRLAAGPAGATLRGLLELGHDRATWTLAWPWPPPWEATP